MRAVRVRIGAADPLLLPPSALRRGALLSPCPRLIHRVSVVVMLRAAELDSILKETKKVPTQKYSEPIASSHEIGERQCVHALLFACGAGRVCGC